MAHLPPASGEKRATEVDAEHLAALHASMDLMLAETIAEMRPSEEADERVELATVEFARAVEPGLRSGRLGFEHASAWSRMAQVRRTARNHVITRARRRLMPPQGTGRARRRSRCHRRPGTRRVVSSRAGPGEPEPEPAGQCHEGVAL